MPRVMQEWYANNCKAAGSPEQLRELTAKRCDRGQKLDYYVNATICQLTVKSSTKQNAVQLLANTELQILNGARILGSVIGNDEDVQKLFKPKTDENS